MCQAAESEGVMRGVIHIPIPAGEPKFPDRDCLGCPAPTVANVRALFNWLDVGNYYDPDEEGERFGVSSPWADDWLIRLGDNIEQDELLWKRLIAIGEKVGLHIDRLFMPRMERVCFQINGFFAGVIGKTYIGFRDAKHLPSRIWIGH
jgi:hypothetical protein